MLYFALLRSVSKRDGQIQSKLNEWKFFNLAPHSAWSCSSCIANCIRLLMRCNFVDSTKTRITTDLRILCIYTALTVVNFFFSWDEWLFVNFFSFRYSQNTLWATFVAFLVFSLFFWLSKHAKSLSERSAKGSAIFTQERSEEVEKRVFIYAWAEYYLQPNTLRISRPLFVGSWLQVTWWALDQQKGRKICNEW